MTNFKGTKGKWKVFESTCGLVTETQCITVKVGENDIVTVWDFSKESQANAQLISKAPEMLKMLERISNINPNHSIAISDCQDEIEKLIKEATEL